METNKSGEYVYMLRGRDGIQGRDGRQQIDGPQGRDRTPGGPRGECGPIGCKDYLDLHVEELPTSGGGTALTLV